MMAPKTRADRNTRHLSALAALDIGGHTRPSQYIKSNTASILTDNAVRGMASFTV